MRKFSIIIPVYNVAPYLRECLRSVIVASDELKALSDKWSTEIICIDDCSTDGSGEILDELSAVYHSSLIVYHSPANAGVSSARNKGLELATGDWVTFVDGDDTVERDWLVSFATVASEDVDLIFNSVRQSDGIVRCVNQQAERQVSITGEEIASRDLLRNNFVFARCFRGSIIERYGIRFDERIPFSEDMAFCFRYFHYVRKAAFASGSWYNYRTVFGSAARRLRDSGVYVAAAQTLRAELSSLVGDRDIPEDYLKSIESSVYLGHLALAIKSCVGRKEPKREMNRCLRLYFDDRELVLWKTRNRRFVVRFSVLLMLCAPQFIRRLLAVLFLKAL